MTKTITADQDSLEDFESPHDNPNSPGWPGIVARSVAVLCQGKKMLGIHEPDLLLIEAAFEKSNPLFNCGEGSTVADKIDGLLTGYGAGEDHEDVVTFFKGLGFTNQMAARIHVALVRAETRDPNIKISSQGVAVDQDYFWNYDMDTCPNGKVQLLSKYGLPSYGQRSFYVHDFIVAWAPLPKAKP